MYIQGEGRDEIGSREDGGRQSDAKEFIDLRQLPWKVSCFALLDASVL